MKKSSGWSMKRSRPGNVDHRIGDKVGNVDTLGTKLARHSFGKNPLRCLGWSKARKQRLAALRCGIVVTRIVPCPACTIAGAKCRAR